MFDMDERFNEWKRLAENFKQSQISGLVFRSGLKDSLFNSSPKGLVQGADASSWHSIPVFFDEQQTEDLLVFENQELLHAYLNRQTSPSAWIYAKAKSLLQDGQNSRLFKPLEPRIPKY